MFNFTIPVNPPTPDQQSRMPSDIQEISITDLISEGPIEGLVNAESSVYLEGDQLFNVDRITIEATKATDTGKPRTISFAAASSEDQPVTASMKDFAGATAYYNDLEETYTDSRTYRWLTVFGVSSSRVKIERINTRAVNGAEFVTTMGDVRVCAVNSSGTENTFFYQSQKPGVNDRNNVFYNLKPVCRIVLPSGQTIKGSITGLYGDNYNSEVTSGRTKRAQMRPWSTVVNAVEWDADIFADDTNEVYGTVYIDRVLKIDIRTISSNNVIYIPKQSANLTITDKPFTISAEQKLLGVANSAGNPSNTQKYPGSTVQFRVGNRSQEPFTQIAGVGVASFPITLTQSQNETFDTTAAWPSAAAVAVAGYPNIGSSVPTGMIQKNIVFSSSFTSAQINEIDKIKIQLEFPQGHYQVNDEGTDGSSGAAFHIELQGSESGGANPSDWTAIDGGEFTYIKYFGLQKTAIAYVVEIPVLTNLNIMDMRLQITRLTEDGGTSGTNTGGKLSGSHLVQGDTGLQAVINTCKIAQVIVTIDEKLEYPYSAMAAVRFSSKSFPRPPKRSYHVRGLKVKVPSNYTPRHLTSTGVATYTGIWNGEFSDEGTSNSSGLDIATYYTDNPAWVFYDILINNRYGLGDFLQAQDINKFQLYKVAKYCDELVPTSNGGTEPRFTANLYLTKAAAAYKVLKDMATIFRGILYWLDGEMITIHDAPATPIYNFSQSNILEGSLSTQTSSSKSRANQYTVIWNNPLSAYKQEALIIEDKQNIIDTGRIINKKAVAFGCTSEGQAIRYGRWKAWTSTNQTETISFNTAINASFLAPGDIINVQDQNVTGTAFSGRITASSNSAVTLDRNITAQSQEPQIDGGSTQGFAFGSSSDYEYELALLVMDRKVVLNQDAPALVTYGGTTYTYNRGDIVTYANIAGTATALIGSSDSDEQVHKNISNIQDNNGNDMQVEFRNSTNIETKAFDSSDVSVVNGVTQIAIPSAFVGIIPSSTVWAIKEEYKGLTTVASYKEYKILGLKEGKNSTWDISGVEFYNTKYDAVDNEFTLAKADTVTPPEPTYVPPPGAVYILQTPDHTAQLNEVQVMWEPPRNSDNTDYDHISSYAIHIEPKLPDGTDLIEINNTQRRLWRLQGIPDGFYSFGLQTFTSGGKRSEITWRSIELTDPFKHPCDRTTEGLPLGIRSNSKMSGSGDTWSMKVVDWAVQSPGAPGTKVNNANQSTAATYEQTLTAMASGSGITKAFIYFDADATTDYFKLMNVAAAKWENTQQPYWRDYVAYIADAENDWTDCTGNADVRVTIPKYSNKVTVSEGSAAFLTTFEIGDIIRIKYAANKYVGGKVAYIEDNSTLYVDRRLNGTSSTLTSVDESKAIARTTLRPDTANDAIVARINRSGSTYTHIPLKWIEDVTLTGLKALIVDANDVALNYDSDGALQNEAAITLTAEALGYDSPEFTITGAGFTQGSPAISASAQSSYIDSSNNAVTDQTLTYQLHDGSGGIGYDSGSSLDFTVTVRESEDQTDLKSKVFKIIKLQDGSVGLDGKTVVLTSDDYSIIYDVEGTNPSYTSSGSSNIVITATANNFTDPLYRFTFAGSAGSWADTSGTSAATYTFASGSIPSTYNKANWPKVVKVEVGEKPSGWSSGAPDTITSTDSISLIGVAAGAGGVSIVNSNHAHTYSTPSTGVATGISITGTTLELIVGGVVYTYIGGTSGYNSPTGTLDNTEWYIGNPTVTGSDVTIGTPSSVANNVVTIGNHTGTADTNPEEVITWPIIYKQAGTTETIETTQTLTKSVTGEATKTISIYKLSPTDNATATYPSVSAVITFASGALAWTGGGSHSNSWYATPQKTTVAKPYLHMRQATITDASLTTTISTATDGSGWGPGSIVAVRGTDGVALTLTASPVLFTLDGTTYDPGSASTLTLATSGGTITGVTWSDNVADTIGTLASTTGNSTNTFTFAANRTEAQVKDSVTVSAAVTGTDAAGVTGQSFGTITVKPATSFQGTEGTDAGRVVTGYVYWQGAKTATKSTVQTAITAIQNVGPTYTFTSTLADATFNPDIGGGTEGQTSATNVDNFSISPPAASSTRQAVFYAPFTATETVTNGSATDVGPVTFGTVQEGINFTGVVTFSGSTISDGTNSLDITAIDGSKITTGRIQSTDMTVATGTYKDGATFTTDGAYFQLATSGNDKAGSIGAKHFRLEGDTGTVQIKGETTGTGGGSITLDSTTQKITITDGSTDRVIIGKLS
jgi:predicted phage tail protein